MLSGFNTNFRYRGVLFHVQTEDSGRENPHVITHLFHGGNILASEKRDYTDLLGDDDLEEPVRKLMESQHKSMLRQLSKGGHDTVIGERLGPDLFRVEDEAADPPAITEEERPAASETLASVVAESTRAGLDGSGTDASEPILEAEFATGEQGDAPEPQEPTRLSRVFGDRVVSERPLDEVVLDYLVENARKRKRPPK
jgi:hypothetical protein